jgi:hypothetical protein
LGDDGGLGVVEYQGGSGLARIGLGDEARIERAMLVTAPVLTAGWVCLVLYGIAEIAAQLL